jgi:hypothetical protein
LLILIIFTVFRGQHGFDLLILIISPWPGTRIMQVVRGPTQSLEDKVELLNDYISRLIQHHLESLENNDFRSKNGQFAAKYIKQARGTLCRDMRRLIMTVMPSFYNFMQVGDQLLAPRPSMLECTSVSFLYWRPWDTTCAGRQGCHSQSQEIESKERAHPEREA